MEKKYIEPNDPLIRETAQNAAAEAQYILGADVVDRLPSVLQEIESHTPPYTPEEKREKLWDALEGSRARLISVIDAQKSDPESDACLTLAEWFSENMRLLPVQGKRDLTHVLSAEDPVARFGEMLSQKTFRPQTFARLIQIHGTKAVYGRDEFVRETPGLRLEFIDRVEKAVQEGYLLPIFALEQKVKEISVWGYDPIATLQLNVTGYFDQTYITASVLLRPAERRHAFFHEATHAIIGGNTPLAVRFTPGSSPVLWLQKIGLTFDFPRANKEVLTVWRWLNEAVTEMIARKLSGADFGSYQHEIDQLEELVSLGIPRRLFIEAYQEQYRADIRGASRLPKLQELLRRIREVRGRNWLREQESR